jgi:hypothetical protein
MAAELIFLGREKINPDSNGGAVKTGDCDRPRWKSPVQAIAIESWAKEFGDPTLRLFQKIAGFIFALRDPREEPRRKPI